MRLKKKQKTAVLEWIASGMETSEINDNAAVFKPPFKVTRQQVDYYRKTRKMELKAIRSVDENNALATGLSLKEERVKKLQQLAALLEKDLLGGFLWLDQVKSIGSGLLSERIEYEEFNKAEVDAYRGVLDDIAKEVGDRVQKQQQITWHDEVLELLRTGQLTPDEVKAGWPELAADFFRQAGINANSND